MNIIEIIDRKRMGETHSRDELGFIIDGVMSGELPDYQLSAWLMAVCCRGLSLEETVWLTELYVQSGNVLDFSGIDGIIVDKHSTGGVGDKTTLVLAPMLAACGLKVAKLSGRGLGFTGGTSDKLEAIPGFNVNLPMDRFLKQVNAIGIALGSQTIELAPADGRIYALRDVTATVASIPLIAASVVSKKIAAGAQVITLDIKVGQGAFMKTLEDAQALAGMCREVGKAFGRKISTVISGMEQPLGQTIGHTLEVMEAIETLQGRGPEDLTDLCLTLGAVTLVDAGLAKSLEDGRQTLRRTLEEGTALAKWRLLVQAQDGSLQAIDHPERMPQPRQKILVSSHGEGFVQHCDALRLAQAAKLLGAGRISKADTIDLGVGLRVLKKVGDRVSVGEPIVEIWAGTQGIQEAEKKIAAAYSFAPDPVQPAPLIYEIFQAS